MNSQKLKKLESIAQELVGKFIFEEMGELEIEFWLINITGIKISSDLSYLDIYVSCFKNEETLAKTLAGHGYQIQKRFNQALSMRKLPKIRFRYDEKWKVGQQVTDTIDSLKID